MAQIGQKVTPPNPHVAFVAPGPENAQRLTTVAFRFLTNIHNALNGEPLAPVGGQQLAQFQFGTVTLSTGFLASPEGLLTGTIGDIFISTNGSAGGILFGKTSGAGTSTGWTLIT